MYTEMKREHILWRLGRDDYKTWPGREIRDPDGSPAQVLQHHSKEQIPPWPPLPEWKPDLYVIPS